MAAETPSLTAIPLDQALQLLHAHGSQHITAEHLAADREAGAPISADGIVNLVTYAAWLAKELADGT